MQYWRTYAVIRNREVVNIAVYAPDGAYTIANDQAHTFYGSDAFAVDVTQIPVAIGDEYYRGAFYRDHVEIIKLPTDEEQIADLSQQIVTAQNDMNDVQIALVELYERGIE